MLAVEGMTLLSSIFRPQQAANGNVRHIGIRNLQPKEEATNERVLTLDEVLHERDQLLGKAHETIAEEKRAIEAMRQTASEDIAAMQAAWQEEKSVLQQEAYEEAFQLGYKEGRDKVVAEMTSSVQIANDVTKKAQENAEQYQASQERVILELAMRTAERIIGESLEAEQSKFLSIVKRALKEAREMKEIKLYVSLDYYQMVSNHRAELASIFPPDVPFLIFANEDFEATECYIETNHGRIVVTIDDQLNEIREQLIEIMESGE